MTDLQRLRGNDIIVRKDSVCLRIVRQDPLQHLRIIHTVELVFLCHHFQKRYTLLITDLLEPPGTKIRGHGKIPVHAPHMHQMPASACDQFPGRNLSALIVVAFHRCGSVVQKTLNGDHRHIQLYKRIYCNLTAEKNDSRHTVAGTYLYILPFSLVHALRVTQ